MFSLRIARQQPRVLAAARAPAFASISKRFNSSDYGSGEHNDLKRSKSEMEHPGPPPPSTGGKKNSSSSKQPESKSESSTQEKDDGSKPKPKIFSPSPPKEESEEVKKHNEDMKQRADRPVEGRKD